MSGAFKRKKFSGIPVLEMDPELLTQSSLAAISKACSSGAAGLVPMVCWLVYEKYRKALDY